MAIDAATIANYAPWGNAQLAFEVSTGFENYDPATGNATQATIVLEYLAALTLKAPAWKPEAGVDSTTYLCEGRLLSPTILDTRLTNGSQAIAQINGYRGRFELTINLAQDAEHYRDIRQPIQGLFRVIGGG